MMKIEECALEHQQVIEKVRNYIIVVHETKCMCLKEFS
jgi:hypothetical protein